MSTFLHALWLAVGPLQVRPCSICRTDCMKCLQIPLFGAFYPPAGNDSHTPHSKDRKRQVYANGRRAVLPKLPCPLLPAHGTAASWEAPEVEDSKETSGSNTLAFAAPAPLTLQQIEAPAANLPVASPDKPHLPEAKSTKDPQLLAAFPQFNHANGNTPSQRAEAQERERGALSQGAQAFSMSGVSESAAKGSIQPQAAPQQATFGQQLISGNLAAPPSTQQGQVSALQPPSNASAADAGGGAGVPAQSTVMPFQPVQPCAVPGQQSGLFLGQPVQQVQASPVSEMFSHAPKCMHKQCYHPVRRVWCGFVHGAAKCSLFYLIYARTRSGAMKLLSWCMERVWACTAGRWHGEWGGTTSASACSTTGQARHTQMKHCQLLRA